MFDVSIERLVQSHQIEASRADRTAFLWGEIRRLKKEKQALKDQHHQIFPHN